MEVLALVLVILFGFIIVPLAVIVYKKIVTEMMKIYLFDPIHAVNMETWANLYKEDMKSVYSLEENFEEKNKELIEENMELRARVKDIEDKIKYLLYSLETVKDKISCVERH